MRIKVPFEVAVAITVALLIFWAVFGAGHLAGWLEKKFSRGKVKWAVRILGYLFLVPALLIANSYYFEQYQRDPVHEGLYKFDLGEVVLSVVLLGATALCWFWARWRLQAAVGAILAGIAVFIKPFIWPLICTWGEPYPYGLTSETHLYFLLSGLGLLALGVILLVRWQVLKKREKVFGPRP
jgi:hypothetical protein